MIRKHLIVLPLLLICFGAAVSAQGKYGHLKSWEGKTPVDDNRKDFFALPEVRTPLRHLLSPADFNLVVKSYGVQAPFKLMGDFLGTTVCRPHNCGDEQAGFAINLKTGAMFVRMQNGTKERWFASEGKATDLPKEVRDAIGNPYMQ